MASARPVSRMHGPFLMPDIGDTFVGGLPLGTPLRSDSFSPAILAEPAQVQGQERQQEMVVRLAQTGD